MPKLKKIYRIESENGSVEVSISDSGKINVHNTFNNSNVHLMEMDLQSAEQFWEALTEVILDLRKSAEEPEEKKGPTPDELLEGSAILVSKEECEELLKALEEKTSYRWGGNDKGLPTNWNPFHGKNNGYYKSSPDALVIFLKYGQITYGPGYAYHNLSFKKAMQILNSSPTGSPVISDNGDGTCDISSGTVEIPKQSIEDRLNNIAVQVNEQQCEELLKELEINTSLMWRSFSEKPTQFNPFQSIKLEYLYGYGSWENVVIHVKDGLITYSTGISSSNSQG